MKNIFIIFIVSICFGEIYQRLDLNNVNEVFYRRDKIDWSSRFESSITYNDESSGFGEFRFNDGDEVAVWYRPLTKCIVEGVQIYFPISTDLVNSEVTIQLRSILENTSIGLPANKEYNFSQYNVTIGDFMGEVLYSESIYLTIDMLEQVIDIEFSTPTDVEDNDFAIQIIGDFGGNNNDLIFWEGVNGFNTNYNHGFKYYPDGASFCPEGCWVPRLNFGISAKVNYYGDHPPIISNVLDLSDMYYSCNPGPYEVTSEIIDIGTTTFDGDLTNVKFYYNNGSEIIESDYTGFDINNVFTGYIPEHPIGTTIEYWWEATDNASYHSDYIENQNTIQRVPKSFKIGEYNEGADILLIDDSSYPSESSMIINIFSKLNQLGFSTDQLNIQNSGLLSSCGMDYYSNFLILQGLNGAGSLMPNSDLEYYLMSRMSEGVNLLFSSVDYIYDVASFTNGWNQVNQNENQFLYHYLNVNQFLNDFNPNELTQNLNGITNNQVSDGINNFIVNSPFTQNYFDLVNPGQTANKIFEIYDQNLGDWIEYGGTMYSGNYKSIFFPWHLEGVVEEEILNEILENTFNWFGVEHTPTFVNIEGPSGFIFNNYSQEILIEVIDEENDPITAELIYSINGSENFIIQMVNLGQNEFSAEIPSQIDGTQINYSIHISDLNGQIQSQEFNYEIYESNSSVLLLLNNEMEVGQLNYPSEYYLLDFIGYQETGVFDYFIIPDYWTLTKHGLTSEELLNRYNTIIEITTTDDYDLHPNYNEHLNLIHNWLEQGNKNYVLAGDETFALANGNWVDVVYNQDHLFYKLGIQSTVNDLSWGGITELMPLSNDNLVNEILIHLNNDESLVYDPEDLIGYTNWMDGLVPTDHAQISIAVDNYAVVIHREWNNGNKTVYMGIDPISIRNLYTNYWYGASEYGILAQALDWFGDIILEIDNNKYEIPKDYKLSPNYPNPFNPVTQINFYIPEHADVELTIYNLLGKKIKTLVNKQLNPGSYQQIWDGKNNIALDVPSGIYFYKLESKNFKQINKMILMK